MMMPDMSKMFDPQTYAKNMQQMVDFTTMCANSKQAGETMKKLSSVWADTWSNCADKQLKMAQNCMEESIECMRDLSSAKSMEEYMAKQANWVKKTTEQTQANAQALASTIQSGQSQATNLISQMVSTQMEWAKCATPATKV